MKYKIIEPAAIYKTEDNTVFIDFGREAFGLPEIEGVLSEPANVEMAVGEVCTQGRLNRNPGGSRIFQNETFTLNSGYFCRKMTLTHPGYCDKTIKFSPEIAPFRYCEVTGINSPFKVRMLTIDPELDDSASHFESDNENLNKIWEFCKYTMSATSIFGMFVDGNRERQPYEGDAYINQLGFVCCNAKYDICRKTIEFLLNSHTWPTEWSLILPVIVRDYVLYSGNTAFIKDCREVIYNCLFPNEIRADGLIPSRIMPNGKSTYDIVDWPPDERDGYEFGEVNFVPNAYLYKTLMTVGQLYGDRFCFIRANQVKNTLRSIMLKNGVFTDNPSSAHTSLHTAMFALWTGVAEASEAEALKRIIRSKGMACSVYGAQFLLETCYLNGMADHGMALLCSKEQRSWNNMLAKGATITMEAWDDIYKPNQDWNHAWGAAPANIIPRFICGIRPVSPGFKDFLFQPNFNGLNYVSFTHPIKDGAITLEYNKGTTTMKRI